MNPQSFINRRHTQNTMTSHYKSVLPIAEYVYTEHFKETNAHHDVYATFAGKKTANEKFLYVFELLRRHDWLPQRADGFVKLSPAHRRWRKRLKKKLHRSRVSVDMDCSTPRKDGDVSGVYRSRGNDAFRAKNYEESLRFYTVSAMTAEIDSAQYALAVANRSAALYHLEEYEHCLRDADRALTSETYPVQNRYKLFERKGNCYRHANRGSLALHAYSDCLLHLKSTQLSLAEKEIIQIRIKECVRKCEETKETEEKIDKMSIKCIRLTEPKNNNTTEVISKCVDIKYSEGMGRGLFVSKDIKPGEILIMEKPFAGVYKNNMWIFNCDYCFKRCLSAIPCPKCSQVLYCDNACLTSAYDSYHNVECSLVYPLKGDPTVEPVHDLAMRCFIQLTNAMGVDRFCSAVTEYNNNNNNNNNKNAAGDGSRTGLDRAGPAGSAPDATFRSVYGLDGNESKRTVSNMFSMHCTASMIASVLLLNGFRVPPCSLGTVGESLVHLLCVSNLNSYAAAEPLTHVGQSVAVASGSRALNAVALVLCPTNSLINHSCDPNVIVQTHGGVEVTRAVQPISKGSQLFTDYGVNFMSHDKDYRSTHLWDQYQFQCRCQACVQNWPTSEQLDGVHTSGAPRLTEDCQLIGIPDTTLAKFNEIVYLLSTHQKINVDCLDFLFSLLDTLYSCNLKKPRSIYFKCIQVIQKCLYSTSDQIRCVID